MSTRREFLRSTLGYSILSMAGSRALAQMKSIRAGFGVGPSGYGEPGSPILAAVGAGRSIMVEPIALGGGEHLPALQFYEGFSGDAYPQPAHHVFGNKAQYLGPGGVPPRPDEFIDLVVVGGGLGGLTTAYALRRHKPVVIEFGANFGGNARGEVWNGTPYSLGGAFMIEPDKGPIADTIAALGLHDVLRPLEGDDPVEVGGKVFERFWSGQGSQPEHQPLFDKYAERLKHYANNAYPELPTPDGVIDEFTKALDRHSLKDEISSWLDGNVPPLMAAALQLYCYSSLGAGWEEVSAAAGINFLAAEEFPLWVFPGGLGQVSLRLWQQLKQSGGADRLRRGLLVFDVRLHPKGVQVTYIDEGEKVRSLVAKAAVMACPKKFYQVMDDSLADERRDAIRDLNYRSYVVANVLINQPTPDAFYDLFLIRNGVPMSQEEVRDGHRIADVVSATWVTHGAGSSVLTCYWPLPFDPPGLMFTFGTWGDGAETSIRRQAAYGVHRILQVLDIPPSAVQQIRLTRWGHAIPVAATGFYLAGTHNILRAPIENKIFFVHSDNWALSAIETTMTEAFNYVPAIEKAIKRG